MNVSRRDVLRLGLAAPFINLGRFRLFAHSQQQYSARAIELVSRSLVMDMLTVMNLSDAKMLGWLRNPDSFTPADLQRFKDSGINVFHVTTNSGSYEDVLTAIAGYNGLLLNHADAFMRIDSPGDLGRVKASGKIGIILGTQNAQHFRRLDDVNLFHSLGQRIAQLTYNSRNMIGNGSTERRDEGLSNYGVAVVERMNAVGMVVDVSHCGDRTSLDACEASKKPVLITHSNARGITPHPRCKPDEVIRRVAATGGVMGITGVRMFVRDREPTTIEHILDHFDYVLKLVGVEHLGVGSDIDLDGYDDMPAEEYQRLRSVYQDRSGRDTYAFRDKIDIDEFAHPKRMFDLTEGLIRRRYSDQNIELILGGNWKRALTQIWTV